MNRGKTRKAEMGRKAAGDDVYGYRTNANGEYAPEPAEAKVVRLVFELVAEGRSIRQARVELHRRGILTRHGHDHFRVGVLSRMLRNDVYLGVYRYQKFRRSKDTDGSDFRVVHSNPIIAGSREKPNHPPLVEPWLFDAVQEKLNANRIATSISIHMATGLLRCEACGTFLKIKHSNGPIRTKTVPTYACTNKANCTAKRIRGAETDEKLWAALVQLFVDPERIHSLIATNAEGGMDAMKRELTDSERQERALKEKQGRLLDLFLEGDIPQAAYAAKNSELEAEGRRLSAQKTDLRQRIDAQGRDDIQAELIKTLRLLARSHKRFTEDQKTTVFRSIIKEARLTADGVELELYVQATENALGKHLQNRRASAKSPRQRPQTVRLRAPYGHPAERQPALVP